MSLYDHSASSKYILLLYINIYIYIYTVLRYKHTVKSKFVTKKMDAVNQNDTIHNFTKKDLCILNDSQRSLNYSKQPYNIKPQTIISRIT